MNEHDDAYDDAMLMVNMQANTRSVTAVFSHFGYVLVLFGPFLLGGARLGWGASAPDDLACCLCRCTSLLSQRLKF
jgi:hypothetical protein